MSRAVVEVGHLPRYAFGQRSIIWWATMGMIAIEGAMFALVITSYLYLKGRSPHWPPGVESPRLLWGTLNTAIMLLSLIPNQLAKKAAEELNLPRVRLWMVTALAFAVAFNIVRIWEFKGLNVWFDENAYGSVVWALLGFHTTHILTDLLDTMVLAVLMFTGPLEGRRFVDVEENAIYYNFVVFAWLPIYAVIYWTPRL